MHENCFIVALHLATLRNLMLLLCGDVVESGGTHWQVQLANNLTLQMLHEFMACCTSLWPDRQTDRQPPIVAAIEIEIENENESKMYRHESVLNLRVEVVINHRFVVFNDSEVESEVSRSEVRLKC